MSFCRDEILYFGRWELRIEVQWFAMFYCQTSFGLFTSKSWLTRESFGLQMQSKLFDILIAYSLLSARVTRQLIQSLLKIHKHKKVTTLAAHPDFDRLNLFFRFYTTTIMESVS